MENKSIIIFENHSIRREWDDQKEKWYFSVIDIVAVLTEQKDYKKAQSYWTTLKNRLKNEESEVVTNCDKLKLIAKDGKKYFTDVADVETILRLVQAVPSKKAEPIKLWLAKVGYDRMQEIVDPEKSVNRARDNWQKHGRTKEWIQRRMMGQETRNKLTDYWSDHNVKNSSEFAILTNIIHSEWSDLTVKEHKALKKLKTQNLRDHMSEAELIFTALAEMSTREISETQKAIGLTENKITAREGGLVAKTARKELEIKTKRSVITGKNFLNPIKKKKKIK